MENIENKRVVKKGARNVIIILILVLIAVGIGIFTYKYYTSASYKLTKLGYSKDEAKKIIEIKKDSVVLNKEYNSKMVELLTSKYFIESNFDKYLAYYNSNTDKSISDVVAIVNVNADKDFYKDDHETDLSKGFAMLVNKYHKLNSDYVPENLVDVSNWYSYAGQQVEEEVYDQYKLMFNAAKKENLTIIINDSYRSLEDQEKSWKKFGDEYAARAGYSEHNTGVAVDVVSPTSNGDTFDQTEEFKWLQNHSYEYGFILRYPKDKEYLTGYGYESWHYRYLGVDLATKVHESGLTYDEYYAYYIENGENN